MQLAPTVNMPKHFGKIIQQRHVLVDLDGLTEVLRHVDGRSQLHEELLFTGRDDGLTQPVVGVHLVGTSTVNARLFPVDWGVVVQHFSFLILELAFSGTHHPKPFA